MDTTTINKKMTAWLLDLREFIHTNREYKIDEKADFRDLVSDVDIAVEKKLTKHIQSLPGTQTILGEESNNNVDVLAEHLWVIDPIDGTSNFIKQADDYGILVAYFKKGEPILSYIYEIKSNTLVVAEKGKGVRINDALITPPENLALNEAFFSINPRKMNGTNLMAYVAEYGFDLRFLGSSVSDALKVVEGKYGAFISPESEPWDRAPYMLISEELGLHMSQFDGSPTTNIGSESFFFGTKQIFEDVYDVMKDAAFE